MYVLKNCSLCRIVASPRTSLKMWYMQIVHIITNLPVFKNLSWLDCIIKKESKKKKKKVYTVPSLHSLYGINLYIHADWNKVLKKSYTTTISMENIHKMFVIMYSLFMYCANLYIAVFTHSSIKSNVYSFQLLLLQWPQITPYQLFVS